MFLDALLMLSDAQALTGTVAILSTNVVDLGNPATKRDIGVGEPMVVSFAADVALAGTTPGITIELLQSANSDLSSPDVIASSGPITPIAAGKIIEIPIPGGRITKRYFGARYTMTGTTPTMTVSAAILPANMSSQQQPQTYAKSYTV